MQMPKFVQKHRKIVSFSEPQFIKDYKDAFHQHYPNSDVQVKGRFNKFEGLVLYTVAIDGHVDGAIKMTEVDIRESTLAFMR